jgi:hypothetical protein
MAPLVCAFGAVMVVVGATFLPFLSGGYDPLARPLSTMAWVLGRVGVLFVPIGLAWLWASSRHTAGAVPPRWLARLTLGTCIFVALVMSLVAFSSSGVLLAAGAAALGGQRLVRLARRFRTPIRAMPRMAPALLTLAPIAVLALQIALAEPLATLGRDRAIANSATLIADIEQHRLRHGVYPASLLAVVPDYKPGIIGVDRYLYEPSGAAYNLMFEEPSLAFGTQRFVVYNPRDEQRFFSHAEDRVRLAGAELEANRGHRAIAALAPLHWKVFFFD